MVPLRPVMRAGRSGADNYRTSLLIGIWRGTGARRRIRSAMASRGSWRADVFLTLLSLRFLREPMMGTLQSESTSNAHQRLDRVTGTRIL